MTDNYGTQPEEHEAGHEEALASEHTEVHEAPSDYEFSDEHGAASESSEDQAASPEGEQQQVRSPLLPVMAAVGGVLLLGVIAWWQFSGHSTPPPPPVASDAPNPTINPVAVTSASSAPSLLPASIPAAIPTSPDSAIANPTASSSPEPVGVSAAPNPIQAPVAVSETKPEPLAIPSSAPVVSAQPVEADDQRIADLTAHIDALQRSVDQVTQQLSQVSNMVAAATAPADGVSTTTDTKDLQDRLNKLEQQLAQLHTSAVSESGQLKTVVSHKTHHKTATHSIKPTQKPLSADAWVLRAASPGQAWVSTGATSPDLKQVHVGDTLDGIGRVTAIEQQGNGWIVKGSKGTIR